MTHIPNRRQYTGNYETLGGLRNCSLGLPIGLAPFLVTGRVEAWSGDSLSKGFSEPGPLNTRIDQCILSREYVLYHSMISLRSTLDNSLY